MIFSDALPTNRNNGIETPPAEIEEKLEDQTSQDSNSIEGSNDNPDKLSPQPTKADIEPSINSVEEPPLSDDSQESKAIEKVPKSATVQRILDLISEMESSNCIEHGGLQKFHPCPLCSGKLITV